MSRRRTSFDIEVTAFANDAVVTREVRCRPHSALAAAIGRSILPVALVTLFACSRGDGDVNGSDTGGALVIALPVEPGTLLPPLINTTQEKEIADQVYEGLATIGPDLNTIGDVGWTPRLAASWQWAADSLSIAFKIRPDARFHDGHPVTSTDVRFSVDLWKDPKVMARLAPNFADIDSISTPDSLTAIAWFSRRSPEQFYNLVYSLLVMPEHLLRDADPANLAAHPQGRSPVGSGPFRFWRWQARTLVEVVADSNHYLGRPKLDKVVWVLTPDPNTALNTVLAEDADVYENVTADAMPSVTSKQQVQALAYASPNYGYLGFNTRDPKNPQRPHPLFRDRELRRALSMAVNRELLFKNVYDTLGFLGAGPFTRTFATADTTLTIPAYDSAGADRLLDSLGWRDGDNDGVREKGGLPLSFAIVFPSSSTPRRRYAELIQAQLRPHGVRVTVEGVDITALLPRMFGGQFDALLNNWQTDPSPSALRDSWRTRPASSRASNLQLYSNPLVDVYIDSATKEGDPVKARAHYRNAYQGIIDDAPAIWLYENRMYMVVNRRVEPVFNGKDVWWRQLRLWSIPPGKRLPRDR
jgi:peptide/nickel transport system substrate-binding protein